MCSAGAERGIREIPAGAGSPRAPGNMMRAAMRQTRPTLRQKKLRGAVDSAPGAVIKSAGNVSTDNITICAELMREELTHVCDLS